VDPAGNLHVIDDEYLLKLAPGAGAPTKLPTNLPFTRVSPERVAVDTGGNIYLTDHHRVLKFAAGANGPTMLPFTGLKESAGVAVERGGNIYVVDIGSKRVLKLPAQVMA
jgi:hypothetical protein